MPKVATCILTHKDKILILKRSQQVKIYKGMWGGVAGYIEDDEQPLQTAYKELKEEANLDKDDVELLLEGKPHKFTDVYDGKTYDWDIYPFVFYIEKKEKIQIDWEHTELMWISPRDLVFHNTVPHLTNLVNELFD